MAVRQMIPETALLAVDIRTSIVRTRVLFPFGPLILSYRIVPRGGRTVLGPFLLPLL